MTNPRWRQRPEGSTWGDWGTEDQLGRLNLLTPEKTLQGVREVQDGRTFCLSLPLDLPGGNILHPHRFPPQLSPIGPAEHPTFTYPLNQNNPAFTDVVCDDQVLLSLQYSTQWDSFAHVGSLFDVQGHGQLEPVFYNGYRAGEDIVGPTDYEDGSLHNDRAIGAKRLGIETFAEKGMQGRGVLLDLRAHFGDERKLIGYDDLQYVITQDQIEIEPGDMLCLHTGFADRILQMAGNPDQKILRSICSVLDGRDDRLKNWITESQITALIADNYAVENFPATPQTESHYAALPLHELCLFKLGVPLGELWYLTDLAKHLRATARSRFLLTAPPLRLPGAVGSPTTPIATT